MKKIFSRTLENGIIYDLSIGQTLKIFWDYTHGNLSIIINGVPTIPILNTSLLSTDDANKIIKYGAVIKEIKNPNKIYFEIEALGDIQEDAESDDSVVVQSLLQDESEDVHAGETRSAVTPQKI